jgi:GntR family transcriptional regulator of gluconate operon
MSASTSSAPPSSRQPLPTSSRRQQIVDVLRDEIITGVRAPGEQLKQDQISADFAVSPGPVREALRQLESEGLAEHFPNRGVFVTDVATEDLLELLLPVRVAIERYAVPLAAEALRTDHLDQLQNLIDEMDLGAQRGDLARINELDVRFHEITVEASGSRHALQLWRSVQPRIRAQIYRLAPRHAALTEIPAEHRELLEAIKTNDPDSLRDAVEQHIIGTAMQLLANTPRGA